MSLFKADGTPLRPRDLGMLRHRVRIGLSGLGIGSHSVMHPDGPMWLLVGADGIERAQLYDRDSDQLTHWSAEISTNRTAPGSGRAARKRRVRPTV